MSKDALREWLVTRKCATPQRAQRDNVSAVNGRDDGEAWSAYTRSTTLRIKRSDSGGRGTATRGAHTTRGAVVNGGAREVGNSANHFSRGA